MSLSLHERQLILKFGYPHGSLKDQLVAFQNETRGRLVNFSQMDLDMVSGDLSRSINHGEAKGFEEELDEIACALESLM
ncbi:MAG: hypothetical protein ACKVHP_02735, partial [Verrucomicrobiales bacterium]